MYGLVFHPMSIFIFLSKGDFICKCAVLRNKTKVVSAIRQE